MGRFKRIATRGWLYSAITVLTFGYYPAQDTVDVSIVCLTLRDRDLGVELSRRSTLVELLTRELRYTLADRVMCVSLDHRSLVATPDGERDLTVIPEAERDLGITLFNRSLVWVVANRELTLTLNERDLDLSMWRRRC